MAADPLRLAAPVRSHSMRLLVRLFDLGLSPRGRFSLVHLGHDGDCPALAGGSGLDCRCNPEVEIGGARYLFSDFMGTEGRA